MNVDAYLQRISYDGPLEPGLETLRALHQAHSLAVPFENLDVALGERISLDPEALFDKIVTRRRGGYCFELNGLFASLLERLGFGLTRLAARVLVGYDAIRPRTHQMMMMEIDGQRWIADVGFGDGPLLPLRFADGDQDQGVGEFRFRPHEQLGHALERRLPEGWAPLYAFTLEPQLPVDYEPLNHYTSTSPESFFTQHLIVTRPTEVGRVTLLDRELKTRAGGESTARTVSSESELREVLRDVFGLEVPGALPALGEAT